jgi:hypothetical protein
MFGKPEWFKKRTWGWGLTPVTWQGWAFTLGAAALIAVPFNILLFMPDRGAPEALIWMALGIAALVLETRSIMRGIDKPKEARQDVLYIGDEEHDSVQTGKLDLKLRR